MTVDEIQDIISKWQSEDKEHRSVILVLHDGVEGVTIEGVQGEKSRLIYSVFNCLQNKDTHLPALIKTICEGIFYLASRKTDVLCKN